MKDSVTRTIVLLIALALVAMPVSCARKPLKLRFTEEEMDAIAKQWSNLAKPNFKLAGEHFLDSIRTENEAARDKQRRFLQQLREEQLAAAGGYNNIIDYLDSRAGRIAELKPVAAGGTTARPEVDVNEQSGDSEAARE